MESITPSFQHIPHGTIFRIYGFKIWAASVRVKGMWREVKKMVHNSSFEDTIAPLWRNSILRCRALNMYTCLTHKKVVKSGGRLLRWTHLRVVNTSGSIRSLVVRMEVCFFKIRISAVVLIISQ